LKKNTSTPYYAQQLKGFLVLLVLALTFFASSYAQSTLTVNIDGNGIVQIDGVEYTGPVTVDAGTTLNILAVPAQYNRFDNWTGDLTSENAGETILMDGDKSITATSQQLQYDAYSKYKRKRHR
jgi:hypothetical protein